MRLRFLAVKRDGHMLALTVKGSIDATLGGFMEARKEIVVIQADTELFKGVNVVVLRDWDKIENPNCSVLGAIAQLIGFCRREGLKPFIDFTPNADESRLQNRKILLLLLDLCKLKTLVPRLS